MSYPDLGTYISNIPTAPVNVVVDLLLIVTFLVFVIRGAKRGFVVSALHFAKPILAVFVAWFACEAVGAWLCEAHFFDGLTDSIKNGITDIVTSSDFQAEHAGQTVTGFTGIIGALLALSGNEELAKNLTGFITGDEAVILEVASAITSVVAVIVSFILLLILVNIGIRLVAALLDKLFKLPGLNVINGLLGLIFGILRGLIICWCLSYVLYFLCTWLGTSMGIEFFAAFGAGEGTYIEQALFNFNPIQWALDALASSLVFADAPIA